jgi:hypothetical protein
LRSTSTTAIIDPVDAANRYMKPSHLASAQPTSAALYAALEAHASRPSARPSFRQ